jgi:aryl-alcohol dehydrogenase-like predicted oxidoreductase
MQFSRLGDTGLIVSRLGFGAMTFGQGQGLFAEISKVDAALADTMVGKTLDAGINHFNTANGYTGGQSEQLLGKALGARRKDVVISTKVGMRTGPALLQQGLSRHNILAECEASLRRLGTDYIDVYLVHRVDVNTPVEETVEALDTLVRQGKVRYAGFSNWPAWMAAKAVGIQKATGAARFRAAELYYSLVGRDFEHELEPFVRDAGIGVFVWSPLAGGLLSGKYSRENPQGDGGRLNHFDFLPHDKDKAYAIVDEVRNIAREHNASCAQVALAWLLTKPAVSSVLMGANTLAQLDDNLGAAKLKLSAEAIAKLNQISAPPPFYPNWFTARVQDQPVMKALAGEG